MENAGSLVDVLYLVSVFFHPAWVGFLLFPNKTAIEHHSCLEGADQLWISGCFVASGSCMPSAADEVWHSPKRPYSTVAVNSSWVCTEVSCPFFCHIVQLPLDGIFFLPLLCPSWDQLEPPPAPIGDQTVFSHHYVGLPRTYIVAWKMQGSLADDLYLFWVAFLW